MAHDPRTYCPRCIEGNQYKLVMCTIQLFKASHRGACARQRARSQLVRRVYG